MPLLALLLAGCPSSPKDGETGDTGCPAAERGTWYTDADGDGYGDPGAAVEACEAPDGAVTDATDCDDAAAAVYPGAPEIWYDGADEDCSGGSDFDQDGDGYDRDEECDDLDPARYPDPAIEEVWYDGVDDNCDGNDGDRDGDGFYVLDYPFEIPAGYAPGDCADEPDAEVGALNGFPAVPTDRVHPGASDAAYDGVDANCDGSDDFDQDADGFRTDRWPDGSGTSGDDCDDTRPDIHPGADDAWYDGADEDCAGNDDYDQDYDGVRADFGDCDDTDAAVRPGAVEDCATTTDEDCDGSENGADMAGCTTFYQDTDGDGYGIASRCACVASGDYTAISGGDCDDGDSHLYPGAVELCDGQRNDCSNPRWSDASEDGLVSVEDPSGVWSDVTVDWTSTDGTPVAVTLPDAGTVWVCAGRYFATVEGPAGAGDVRLVGRHGDAETAVYALGMAPVLTVEGAGVTVEVEGLTLTGGSASYGGGVYVTDATVTLIDSSVQSNRAQYGGGAYVDGGSLTLDGTDVMFNTVEVAGGGVYAIDAELTMTNCQVLQNQTSGSGSGGAGGVMYTTAGTASLLLADVSVTGNTVDVDGTYGQGGGVYVSATGTGSVALDTVTLSSNHVYAGTHAYGGGLRVELGGTTDATFADLDVSYNLLLGQTLAYGAGAYLWLGGTGALTLTSATFTGGSLYSGSPAGGGVYVAATGTGDVTLSDVTATGHTLRDYTGGSTVGAGGGVYLALNTATVTLERATVSGNDSATGDGVEVTTRAGSRLDLVDSDIVDNTGYGITVTPYDTTGLVSLQDSRVRGNTWYGVELYATTGYVANLECRGDKGVDAGIYDNGYNGVLAYCTVTGGACTISASRCDLGVEGSASDNTNGDMYVDYTALDGWGDDASFTCTNASCT